MTPQPAPKNFNPAGRILLAKFTRDIPEFLRTPPRYEGARAEGIRYERKAKVKVTDLYQERFVDGPWIHFLSAADGPPRFCQPDGLLFDIERGFITVLEFKLAHTDHAWWQLHYLYVPVVEFLFPHWSVRGVEVAKWFDPSTRVSGPVTKVRDLEQPHSFSRSSGRPELFVHILKA